MCGEEGHVNENVREYLYLRFDIKPVPPGRILAVCFNVPLLEALSMLDTYLPVV